MSDAVRNLTALSLLAIVGLAESPARANGKSGGALIGLSAGVVLPQIATEFAAAPGVELEGGWRAAPRLAAVVAVGYSQPKVAGGTADARLVADRYTTETTQRELTTTLGATVWLREPGASVNAFGTAGARAWLLETITTGEAGGASFGENRETSTRFGGVVALGGELALGPGAALLKIEFGGADLPHLITGDVSTTALVTAAGYRLFF